MGFAVWTDREQAWAQGTHEYRPMGAAVISIHGVFSPRDFRRSLRPPHRYDPRFRGYFASLGEVNDWLHARRRRRPPRGDPAVAQVL